MGKTSIQWTDRTWSPIRVRVKADAAQIAEAKGYESLVQIAGKMAGHVGPHCEHVSPGCENCYSGTNNHRCLPNNGTGLPFDRRSRDLVEPFIDDKILREPLKWLRPQRVFVENQSDLFGEWVTEDMIDQVFAVMASCPSTTFQVLTKRAKRMHDYSPRWSPPLPNVHLGVSVENRQTADERIPWLLVTPAAVRFVSYEPVLGGVNFYQWLPLATNCESTGEHRLGTPCPDCGDAGTDHRQQRHLDWLIIGGESGPGARPFDIQWARDVIRQCKTAGVAAFVKQLGSKPTGHDGCSLNLRDRKGGNIDEWPQDLRVRQFPEVNR